MKIAVTGGTGFLGRYILQQLLDEGRALRAWRRRSSDMTGFSGIEPHVEWLEGELGDERAARALVDGCDAVVHAALYHPGRRFHEMEGQLLQFVEKNLLGTLQIIEASRAAGVSRFVFISTCAVHDVILSDRPLDETHPLWPKSHYGAHKAAIEKFIHSFGLGEGYAICALRPTGIYGLAAHPEQSRWFELIRAAAGSQEVECRGGGKEVHAGDVARAVSLLLTAPGIAGQSYNCCDMYVADFTVAQFAKEMSGSKAILTGEATQPKHQIETGKLRALGMKFGGTDLLRKTIGEILEAAGRL